MALTTNALDDDFHVGPQIMPSDVDALREAGFEMIINNRPDGEEQGQPSDEAIEAAAREAGLDYAHVPLGRGMGPADIEAERAALDRAKGKKTFAYCRSGTRSTLLWAAAEHEAGRDVAELRNSAEAAGYSLDPIEHLL